MSETNGFESFGGEDAFYENFKESENAILENISSKQFSTEHTTATDLSDWEDMEKEIIDEVIDEILFKVGEFSSLEEPDVLGEYLKETETMVIEEELVIEEPPDTRRRLDSEAITDYLQSQESPKLTAAKAAAYYSHQKEFLNNIRDDKIFAQLAAERHMSSLRMAQEVLDSAIAKIPTPSCVALTRPPVEIPEKLPYFTPSEVVVHNKFDDIWVSYLGYVYNLTPLIEEYAEEKETLLRPILSFAGKDISDWFDEETGDIAHYVHPVTGVRVPYCPHGRVPHVKTVIPKTDWKPLNNIPWWMDKKYRVGILTERARPIRVLNILTGQECTLNVCKEDTLNRILERLMIFNSQATSYVWKFETRILDMDLTLEENGIPDERDDLVDVFLPESLYIPALCLYFKDDLEWDEESPDDCE